MKKMIKTVRNKVCAGWALFLALGILLCACSGGTEAPGATGSPEGTSGGAPLFTMPAKETSGGGGQPSSGGDGQTGENVFDPPRVEYTVKPAEWASVEWERYESPYFTLTIPKGWEVRWQGNAEKLFWNCVKPGTKLGVSNQDHVYAYKDYRMYQANGGMFLQYGTVEELFCTSFADTADYFTVLNSCVPSNYALLQSVRPNDPIRDYKSLYAIFSQDGVEGEGVYSAVMATSRDVWVGGVNYGVWEADCVCTSWAPRGELVNWYPVLHRIMQSFAYTSYYVQEWRGYLGTNVSPDGSNSGNDSVIEAFEERSTADTILQEKRSDMIGEYERVVDNETGNIYRAYNGFLEDIGTEQKRYTAITESQYADGYVGWIEK